MRKVDDLGPALRQQIVCLTLIDRADRLSAPANRLAAAFGDLLACTMYARRCLPGWHFLSIHDAHKDMKAAAYEIIGSNQEDSAIRWISAHQIRRQGT